MYTAGNKIGETGIKAIQEAMKANTTLVNLGIDGFFHCFNHGDEETLLTWLVNFIGNEFGLKGMKVIGDMFKSAFKWG